MIRKALLVAGAMVMLTALAPFAWAGECGDVSTISYRTANDTVTTGSPTFVDMPNASVQFTTSSSDRCVFVRFMGVFDLVGDAEIQVVLDGTRIAAPGPIPAGSRFFELVFNPVPTGFHIVRVQWRSKTTYSLGVSARTLTASY